MRISPIRSYFPKKQNISFGKYENERVKKLITDKKILKLNEDTGIHKMVYEYLDETPFVTIKSTKGKNGDDVLYAVMNKSETDKHKNKDRFDKVLSFAKEWNELSGPQDMINLGLGEKEYNDPCFLYCIRGFAAAYELFENIWDSETGYVSPPTKPSEPEPVYKEDPFFEAIDLYGFR